MIIKKKKILIDRQFFFFCDLKFKILPIHARKLEYLVKFNK